MLVEPIYTKRKAQTQLLADATLVLDLQGDALQFIDTMGAGWELTQYRARMGEVITKAHQEAARLHTRAEQDHLPAYQDLAAWAQAVAAFAEVAQHLEYFPGTPSEEAWNKQNEVLDKQQETLKAKSFDPVLLAEYRSWGTEEASAREMAHDTPAGHAAAVEAQDLEAQINARYARRNQLFDDLKLRQEQMDAASKVVDLDLERELLRPR
jgi:hypothetical protein